MMMMIAMKLVLARTGSVTCDGDDDDDDDDDGLKLVVASTGSETCDVFIEPN